MGEMGFNPAAFGRRFVRVINAALRRTTGRKAAQALADITTSVPRLLLSAMSWIYTWRILYEVATVTQKNPRDRPLLRRSGLRERLLFMIS